MILPNVCKSGQMRGFTYQDAGVKVSEVLGILLG